MHSWFRDALSAIRLRLDPPLGWNLALLFPFPLPMQTALVRRLALVFGELWLLSIEGNGGSVDHGGGIVAHLEPGRRA